MVEKMMGDFSREKAISNWLFIICGMILAMIVLGGITRLTHSGLSMVHWKPVTGWLPPLNQDDWIALFEAYKTSPEYTMVNFGMGVEEFKGIFWLEFIHRLWGRAIGLVFFLPFIFFIIRGWVSMKMVPMLSFLFVLGGMQGVLGWYMVKSGLVDRPDVSQYRLAAHLCLAIFIFAIMLRYALRLRVGVETPKPALTGDLLSLTRLLKVTAVMIFITILSGGFVAGLDAGLIYNTFPLMDGELIPSELYPMTPGYLSAFEDIMTVQFNHRVLAISTLILVVITFIYSRKSDISSSQSKGIKGLLHAAMLQVVLGITTLVLVVPVPIAALHQFFAVILLSAAIVALNAIEWHREPK